jgi:hypothetical protein
MPKGFDYDRLLEEFIAKGGDLARCPFDTDDYKWEDPPYKKRLGSDCDDDPILDEVWDEIQKEGLKGEPMTEEQWAEWEKEYQEIIKKSSRGCPDGPRSP